MIKKKRFYLGFLVTFICLYFVFRGIDLKELFSILKKTNILLLLLTIVIYIVGYYIRAIRWHYILKHIKEFKAFELFPYLVMGFMFNNILPARAGEFIRAYITGEKKGISKSSTFASIIIERVFDGLVMIFYFILGYISFYVVKEQVVNPVSFNLFGRKMTIKEAVMIFAIAGSLIFIGIFVISLLLLFKKEPTVNFLHNLMKSIPGKLSEKFLKLIDTFIEGLGVLRNKKDLLIVFLYTFFAWSVEVLTYYLMAMAMKIEINFFIVCLIMAVSNFAIMAPSTSGGVGPFEFFGVGVMLIFAYTKEIAVSYIILIHGMILLPIIFLGIIFVFTEGLNFGKLIKTKKEE